MIGVASGGVVRLDILRIFSPVLADITPQHFLPVQVGDKAVIVANHQPQFGAGLIDRSLGKRDLVKRVEASDPRYLTTYYAIDAVNFAPATVASALDRLDAPYLPLVMLEAAGIPLDLTFSEQGAMLRRCSGLFYSCEGGTAVKKLNRLLMDAGLIVGF